MSKSFLIGSSNKSLDLLHTAYVPTYSNNFKCINSFNFMKGRYYNSHFTDGKTEAQKVKGLTRGYSENNWQWWSLPPSQECWTPVLPLLLILKIEGMCGFLYFLNQKLAFWIIIGQFKNMTACRDRSESGKTEIGPLGSTLKSQNTGRTFHLPLPSRGRGSELGVFSWSYCTALEGDGVWQVSAMDFPTCPNAPLFSIALTWGAVTFQLAFEVLTKTIYGSYTIYSC